MLLSSLSRKIGVIVNSHYILKNIGGIHAILQLGNVMSQFREE